MYPGISSLKGHAWTCEDVWGSMSTTLLKELTKKGI